MVKQKTNERYILIFQVIFTSAETLTKKLKLEIDALNT